MKLVLFRHGLAMEREEAMEKRIDDSMRPLTDKGRERSRRMGKVVLEIAEEFDVLVSSPLLRAKQTAAVLREVIPFPQSMECAELVPGSPPEAFARWLSSAVPRATSVLAVGHEPQLSTFASWALAGCVETFIDLKKSGALGLELESFDTVASQTAELKWLLPPRLF
ncbi:MAG: phosphohistidine phosphatase [Bdellovibrio sp.]|nr:MAG: phosphohistidine phosphatase [Bdellovibrio sp.]